MKRYKISMVTCLMILLVIAGSVACKSVKETKSDTGTTTNTIKVENSTDDETVYINIASDGGAITSMDTFCNACDLIIEGTITAVKNSQFEPFVNEEIEQMFIEEGRSPEYYSDIWTYYDISIDSILLGACDDTVINYKAAGGQIDNVIMDQKIELEEGKTYVFFLEYKMEFTTIL